MSYSLYVANLPRKITLDQLLIYFSSERHSGGGDLDFDACTLNGDKAVVVFEKSEGKSSHKYILFMHFNRKVQKQLLFL